MQKLEEQIAYRFRDKALLSRALTHSSRLNAANNQRLEFLGDAVLGVVIAEMLYTLYPEDTEGELARRQAALVRGATLSEIAQECGLGEHLILSASEENASGRSNASNLEDACEALIGALYLDGGLQAAKEFILPRWGGRARAAIAAPKDAKTALQEWAQGKGYAIPTYTLIESTGPAHAPVFTIECCVDSLPPERAQAGSKRVAEQTAASQMLAHIESRL